VPEERCQLDLAPYKRGWFIPSKRKKARYDLVVNVVKSLFIRWTFTKEFIKSSS
jgi:hypothetical protein